MFPNRSLFGLEEVHIRVVENIKSRINLCTFIYPLSHILKITVFKMKIPSLSQAIRALCFEYQYSMQESILVIENTSQRLLVLRPIVWNQVTILKETKLIWVNQFSVIGQVFISVVDRPQHEKMVEPKDIAPKDRIQVEQGKVYLAEQILVPIQVETTQ